MVYSSQGKNLVRRLEQERDGYPNDMSKSYIVDRVGTFENTPFIRDLQESGFTELSPSYLQQLTKRQTIDSFG